MGGIAESTNWREGTRISIKEALEDPILSALLERSNVTKVQFETLLIDQLGHDMANKRLTREEMAQIPGDKQGISRGSLNRTLGQARVNISEAIHTVLLLGYAGLMESPSLAPFLEASEQLKSKTGQLWEIAERDPTLYRGIVEQVIRDLEEAFQALYGKARDTR